jgi:MinD superfamily P-loop ATPase
MMKQLIVLSGKGGTGKTSVTAALAHMAVESTRKPLVMADADVDAANLELVLTPQTLEQHEFWSGKAAAIDTTSCSRCGDCITACRFDAIRELDGDLQVDPLACEGCAACSFVCPEEAIAMVDQLAGIWFRSTSRFGPLYHASLKPGQENSGKLVSLIKTQALREASEGGYARILVDGPPGIACPVISSVSGADLALIVTEPTVGGIHDLERILETTDHFGLPTLVCINKADLLPEGSAQIESACRQRQIEIIARIPFDISVTDAMVHGQPVTAFAADAEASLAIRKMWSRLEPVWNGKESTDDPLQLPIQQAVKE